jgi:hypothetical protein
MDIKQFLSWNLTAVPCVRLAELIRTGTADLIGHAVRKGKTPANPEAARGQTSYTKSTADKLYNADNARLLAGVGPNVLC